jgi:hypothetical protein
MSGAFHSKDGWWWDRLENGDVGVTITGLTSNPEVIDAQIVFNPDTWASIVSSVSASGDNAETWGAARRFHNGQAEE